MNCEDVPMSEWDKLTGAEQEAKELAIWSGIGMQRVVMHCMDGFVKGDNCQTS